MSYAEVSSRTQPPYQYLCSFHASLQAPSSNPVQWPLNEDAHLEPIHLLRSYTPPRTAVGVCPGLKMMFGVEELRLMAHQDGGFPGRRKEVNGKEDMGESEETKKTHFANAYQESKFQVPPPLATFALIASPNTQPRPVVVLR